LLGLQPSDQNGLHQRLLEEIEQVIGVRGAYGLWIVALVLLGLSLGVAVRVLRLPGTEQNGPLVAEILEARRANDDDTIEEQLLDDLAHETFANGYSPRGGRRDSARPRGPCAVGVRFACPWVPREVR
jgi:hypothetical protein